MDTTWHIRLLTTRGPVLMTMGRRVCTSLSSLAAMFLTGAVLLACSRTCTTSMDCPGAELCWCGLFNRCGEGDAPPGKCSKEEPTELVSKRTQVAAAEQATAEAAALRLTKQTEDGVRRLKRMRSTTRPAPPEPLHDGPAYQRYLVWRNGADLGQQVGMAKRLGDPEFLTSLGLPTEWECAALARVEGSCLQVCRAGSEYFGLWVCGGSGTEIQKDCPNAVQRGGGIKSGWKLHIKVALVLFTRGERGFIPPMVPYDEEYGLPTIWRPAGCRTGG
jgi:hypothetical protein